MVPQSSPNDPDLVTDSDVALRDAISELTRLVHVRPRSPDTTCKSHSYCANRVDWTSRRTRSTRDQLRQSASPAKVLATGVLGGRALVEDPRS